MRSKIVDEKYLKDFIKTRGSSIKLVLTNGCFDVLHIGHVRYLQESKSLGDILVVAINSDLSVKALKGDTRPVLPLEERMEIVAALECVDFVLPLYRQTAVHLVESLSPHVYTKGGDYKSLDDIPEAAAARKGGAMIALVHSGVDHSTSDIISSVLSMYAKD